MHHPNLQINIESILKNISKISTLFNTLIWGTKFIFIFSIQCFFLLILYYNMQMTNYEHFMYNNYFHIDISSITVNLFFQIIL